MIPGEPRVGILGCGWLGFPLAKKLLSEGYLVKGSTSSSWKKSTLAAAGIQTFELLISPEGVLTGDSGFFENTDILIIAVPPGLHHDSQIDFSGVVAKLSGGLSAAGISKLIFISSTAVFAENSKFSTYSEESAPNSLSRGGRQLLAAERLLSEKDDFDTTIIRFGGLVGPDRHPARVLSGRKSLPNPLAPVNLIHLEDAVNLISRIIRKNAFRKLYHGVHPLHPPKEKFYTKKALELGLEPPSYDHSSPSKGKVVLSEAVARDLDFCFRTDL